MHTHTFLFALFFLSVYLRSMVTVYPITIEPYTHGELTLKLIAHRDEDVEASHRR